MKITARIELPKKLTAKFKELKMPLSGGYEEGFEDGKEAGYVDGVKDGEAIGYEKGHGEGYEDGYTEGSALYDEFWDTFQQNGDRTDYRYAFAYVGWTADSFKPKYTIKPINAERMFYESDISGDLRQLAEIDFSNCSMASSFTYTFSYSDIDKIGVVDTRKCSSLNSTFYTMSNLTDIELVKLKTDGSQILNSLFYCDKLQEVRFDGVIGNSLAMSYCPKLSTDSMKNIISCLKNFTDTGSENTKKISFTAKCWEALEADSAAPDGGTWKDYVQYVLCWNV